jgi:NAD(P)H-dependent FMN reductase
MGASTGRGASALSQAAWLPVMRFLGMRPWFERAVLIAEAARVFDVDGRVVDAAMLRRIRAFVEGFAAFAAAQPRQFEPRVDHPLAPQLNPGAAIASKEAR